MAEATQPPTFREALAFWWRLGWISFGGPAGQIAILQTELVDRKKWISQERFLHALNYCMLLPGPEAQQLATYCGWMLHRTWGGLVAGSLFVLPSALLLWALSWTYVVHGSLPWVAGIMAGLKPAILAVIVAALVRISRRTLTSGLRWGLAIAAFVALAVLNVPFPAVIFAAAAIGALVPAAPVTLPRVENPEDPRDFQPVRHAVRVLAVGGVLWVAPLVVVGLCLGPAQTFSDLGLFFSKAAMVTFGGAYAVLPYVGQQAVEHYGWLTTGQMMDGLSFAESTPGPLIMVLQFVGFMAGWNHPGTLSPLGAATLGAFVTTWVTFVPCFIWIFLGAPYIDRWRNVARLNGALGAVTAAVSGVILNLAFWFGQHLLVPVGGGWAPLATVLTALCLVALIRFQLALHWVLLGAALVGLVAAL